MASPKLSLGIFFGLVMALTSSLWLFGGTAFFSKGVVVEASPSHDPVRVAKTYDRIPMSFEANQGQVDSRVKFLARGPGYTLFVTPPEAVLSLRKPSSTAGVLHVSGHEQLAGKTARNAVLRMRFKGNNPNALVTGIDQLPGIANYFIGNDPKAWRTNIPTFAGVKVQNIYPGIDLVYRGAQGRLEYDLVVAPGADPSTIKFEFRGADKLQIDPDGDLIVGSSLAGPVIQKRPVVYQNIGGRKQIVSGSYALAGNFGVTYKVGSYDRAEPLVIDPLLTYASYLGGSGADAGFGIAVDGTGNAWVTGSTASVDFPTTANALQATLKGNTDVFITKINSAGTAILYSTYAGGANGLNGFQRGMGVAVDPSGNAYVTGNTDASDYPVTPGAFQTQFPDFGAISGFVTALNQNGGLIYSTFLSGSGQSFTEPSGIAVNSTGSAYVTGTTGTTDFPVTGDALQDCSLGNQAAFVTRFNPLGTGLEFSTCLGLGSFSESGIALDAADNVYVAGAPGDLGFPVASGPKACNPGPGGGACFFVLKLDNGGPTVGFSTITVLGSADKDHPSATQPEAIAVNSSGSSSYVVGTFRGVSSGNFFARLDATGVATIQTDSLSALLRTGLAVAPSGAVLVTGRVTSAVLSTTPGAFQPNYGGGSSDAFLTELDPAGTIVNYSTYLGGSGSESGPNQVFGPALAVDAAGNAYLTGTTDSSNFL